MLNDLDTLPLELVAEIVRKIANDPKVRRMIDERTAQYRNPPQPTADEMLRPIR